MRFRPQGGSQVTCVDFRQGLLADASMFRKNCGTERKMIGVLLRQQCGYWCTYFSRPSRCTAFGEQGDDGFVGGEDVFADQIGQSHFIGEIAVVIHGRDQAEAVFASGDVVFHAMAGGGVDLAGAGVVGDENWWR